MPVPDNKTYLLWNDPGGNTTITVTHVTWGASSGEHAMLMPPAPGKVSQGAGSQGREQERGRAALHTTRPSLSWGLCGLSHEVLELFVSENLRLLGRMGL